jgi:hypothetical protein
MALLCWVPFVVCAWIDRLVQLPLEPIVRHPGAHARLLIAVPMFAIADRLLAARCRDALTFLRSDQILDDPPPEPPRRPLWLELTLLGCAEALGQAVFWGLLPSGGALTGGSALERGLAGGWYAFVAFPVFVWLALRVLIRWLEWTRILFRLSRSPLRPSAAHPDMAGGLTWLARPIDGLAPFVVGITAVAVASWAPQVIAHTVAKTLLLQLLGFWAGAVFVISFGPYLPFIRALVRARWRGMREYDHLAMIYTRRFHCRWIEREPDHELLGSADIQSLNDLQSAVGLVHRMRVVPFGRRELGMMIVAIVLPCIPLLLAVVPLNKLLMKVASSMVGIGP